MSIDRDLICRLEFIRDYECKVDAEVNAINEALAELSKHTEEHTETHACDNKRTETHGVCLDAISRHAAIDAINHICPVDTQYDCTLLDRVDVRCVLSDLPSAKPEPHWIPVSERLPNGWKDVLVWFEYFRYGDYNRMYSTYGIGNYSNQYDSWLINHETGWKDLHVFAWMPMPEPWEGEKE